MAASTTVMPRVVILCGGRGTRLGEESLLQPKPLLTIGTRPILWHIMKIYSHYGFRRFVLCLGYRGDMIRNYFLNYRQWQQDVTVHLGDGGRVEFHQTTDEDWEITLVDTGVQTLTGGRLASVARFVDTDDFLFTYGDGLADVNVADLLRFHRAGGHVAPVTAVRPRARFGDLEIANGRVTRFSEKAEGGRGWINGGFFALNRRVFDHIEGDVAFEREPVSRLVEAGQLAVFEHHSFWQCMDTMAERDYLNALWPDPAPWTVWR
jgi:glucose-1-phosphate cytidylyltransferase